MKLKLRADEEEEGSRKRSRAKSTERRHEKIVSSQVWPPDDALPIRAATILCYGPSIITRSFFAKDVLIAS